MLTPEIYLGMGIKFPENRIIPTVSGLFLPDF
jgi:hypothetical protein